MDAAWQTKSGDKMAGKLGLNNDEAWENFMCSPVTKH